jgi:hypothetical protein
MYLVRTVFKIFLSFHTLLLPCIRLAGRMGMHDAPVLGMLLLVHILFLISIASLLAVIGAAAAIVHHIRINRYRHGIAQAPPEPSFADHLQAATEYGTPRSQRIVAAQSAQAISSRKEWTPETKADSQDGDAPARGHHSGPQLIRRSSGRAQRQEILDTDTIQKASTPHLRVVAGNHIASRKN